MLNLFPTHSLPSPTIILLPTLTDTVTPTNTLVPTVTPTDTIAPPKIAATATNTQTLSSRSYPCDAEVISKMGASRLHVVRSQPGGRIITSAIVGATVYIVAAQDTNDIKWYRISDTNEAMIGWIDGVHLQLSPNCP